MVSSVLPYIADVFLLDLLCESVDTAVLLYDILSLAPLFDHSTNILVVDYAYSVSLA